MSITEFDETGEQVVIRADYGFTAQESGSLSVQEPELPSVQDWCAQNGWSEPHWVNDGHDGFARSGRWWGFCGASVMAELLPWQPPKQTYEERLGGPQRRASDYNQQYNEHSQRFYVGRSGRDEDQLDAELIRSHMESIRRSAIEVFIPALRLTVRNLGDSRDRFEYTAATEGNELLMVQVIKLARATRAITNDGILPSSRAEIRYYMMQIPQRDLLSAVLSDRLGSFALHWANLVVRFFN
jgi:hypothetical protein